MTDTLGRAREMLAAARIECADLFGDRCAEATAIRAIVKALTREPSEADVSDRVKALDDAATYCKRVAEETRWFDDTPEEQRDHFRQGATFCSIALRDWARRVSADDTMAALGIGDGEGGMGGSCDVPSSITGVSPD